MSNKENPCAGYLIEAAKLEVFVHPVSRPAFHDPWRNTISRRCRSLGPSESLPVLLVRHRYSSQRHTGPRATDMEEGVAYAYFDEGDLYDGGRSRT